MILCQKYSSHLGTGCSWLVKIAIQWLSVDVNVDAIKFIGLKQLVYQFPFVL